MKRQIIAILVAAFAACAAGNVFGQDAVKKKLVLKLTPMGKQLAKDGLVIASEDFADMDGDGKDELVLIVKEPKKGGRTLAILHQNEKASDYEKMHEYKIKKALDLDRLEIDDITGDGKPEAILWLKDDSPDEVGRHLSIHGFEGTFHTMFEYSYFSQPKHGAGAAVPGAGGSEPAEPPPDKPGAPKVPTFKTVAFGQVAEDLRFVDEDRDGRKEIVIPSHSPTIDVESKKGGKVSYIVGARYEVYRLKGGRYVKDAQDKFVNFLEKPVKAKTIEASTEATDKKTKQVTNPAAYAADGNVGSAWVPAGKKGGVGDSIKFWFDDKVPMRAMIIVPGCMEDEEAWDLNHRIKTFSLEFSSGETAKIDRTAPLNVESPVTGVKEKPLPQTKNAVQTIVLFEEGFSSRNVKVEILDLDKVKKGGKVCLSEVMIY
ncbi:MAG: hypothetical protein HY897_08660 [Deltaproteobacteria bacterium]|nr:hypothetical protein [Deltaproteobacteria bacterium]